MKLPRITTVLKLAVAVVLLVWLARSNYLDFNELKRAFHPVYLPLVILVTLAMLVCAAERFRCLLMAQGVTLNRRHNFELFFIGHLFNFVVPGGVGGDVIKAFYLHKDVGHASKTSPYTVLFDRFIGLYVLAALAMVVVVVQWSWFRTVPELKTLSAFVLFTFLGTTTLIVVGFIPWTRELSVKMIPRQLAPVKKIIEMLASSCEQYSRSPGPVFTALFWGVLGQTCSILCLGLVCTAISPEPIPLSAYLFVGPLGYVVSSLPISPGGIGVGQAAFLFLFDAYLGHKTSLGPTAITVVQAVSLSWASVGLYFYLARRGDHQAAIAKPTSSKLSL